MKNKILILLFTSLFCITFSSFASDPPPKENLELNIKDVGNVSIPLGSLKSDTKQEEPKVISKVNSDLLYNDFKSLAIHYGGKADTLVTKAFNILTTTTAEIWDVLVNQQRVNALYHLTLVILELWLIYRWFIFLGYYLKKPVEDRNENQIGLLSIFAALLIAFGVYNSIHMIDVYTGLFNPKYAAMKEILELGKYLK